MTPDFYNILGWVQLALTAFAVFAFVDAALRRDDAYRAAGKQSKAFWLIILAVVAAVSYFLSVLQFLPIMGLVATIVYMVDVRPALREITGGVSRSRRGSSSDGPYGPYNGGR